MKTNTLKIFTCVLATAVCLGWMARAQAFWTDGGREGSALEQLGIAADVKGEELALPQPEISAVGAADRQTPGVSSPQRELIEAMKPWVEKYAKVRQDYINDDGILGNALKAIGLKCLIPRHYRGSDYHSKFGSTCMHIHPADLLEAVKNSPDLTKAQADELKRIVAGAIVLTKRDWERTTGGSPSDGMTYEDCERFLVVLEGKQAAPATE